MRHRHWYLLFLLGCSLSVNANSPQNIQQLRTLSYSLLENVLVYHNPQGIPFDSSNAEAYRADLERLRQQANSLGLADVTTQTKQLEQSVADLRNLPQSSAEMRSSIPPYSLWIPQIIEQQAQLSSTLSALYVEQPTTNPAQQALHDLSLDISRLALSYQIAAFPHLIAQMWILDDQTIAELDTSIAQRFETLPRQYPDIAAALNKQQSHYHFVRRYLTTPGSEWAPNAVERYLTRTTRALDSAAAGLEP